MRFLVAGLGSIGRRHLRNLVALGERDVILYRTGRSTLADDELGGFPVETNLEAALDRRPDAVVVANPTALHLEVSIAAAERGCHLLLEKPVSHSLEGTANLEAALRRGGGRILVGFQLRFHPTLQAAGRVLAEGALGRPVFARAHWGEYLPNWHPWEDYRLGYAARADLGGGVVLTLCHPLDYLGWLLGRPEVTCARVRTAGDLGIAVDDVADIGLRFPDGASGSVHLDFLQQPASHELEVIGTQGTLRWNGMDGSLAVYRTSAGVWERSVPPEGFGRDSLFVDEMRHFLAICRSEALPVCTLDDGLFALRIALAALAFGVARDGRNRPAGTTV
ncbi:MAG: Gfo/Idh/MocA family oxidoreductase [Deltaproteobacteria bacterium]|nr:Gfo/Idh/MocA family oxidoreductase [Deltaproteobacteria bacterium]